MEGFWKFMMLIVLLYAIYWGINHVDKIKTVFSEIDASYWFQSVFLNPRLYPQQNPQKSAIDTTSRQSYIRVLDERGNVIKETVY